MGAYIPIRWLILTAFLCVWLGSLAGCAEPQEVVYKRAEKLKKMCDEEGGKFSFEGNSFGDHPVCIRQGKSIQ